MDCVSDIAMEVPHRRRRRLAVQVAYGATAAASGVFAWLTASTPDVFVHEFWTVWFVLTSLLCLHTTVNPYSGRSIAWATAASVVAFWSRAAAILLGHLTDQLVLQPARAGLGVVMWTLLGLSIWVIGYGASVNGAFISPRTYEGA